MTEKSAEMEFACDLARQAGEILSRGYGTRFAIEHKGPVDLVTEYDRRSEALILKAIRRNFPEDRILSEESGVTPASGSRVWLVDPLDGTTNFAHGVPVFTVSIAAVDGQGLWLGVVHEPARAITFWGERGKGAYLGQTRLRVSGTGSLRESLLATGFPYDASSNPNNNLDHYSNFAVRSQGVRRFGSAALDLAYVAAGWLDGYWDLRLGPWDVAAGALLVTEAGGRVTDLEGGPDILTGHPSVLATNGPIHGAMLEVLSARGRHVS